MRLIDADQIRYSWQVDDGEMHDGITLQSIINKMPTILQWISVKDELPKRNGKYLCVCDCFGHRVILVLDFAINLEKIDKYDFSKKRRRGWYAYSGEFGYCERDNITHWTNLPPLPKGDNNG